MNCHLNKLQAGSTPTDLVATVEFALKTADRAI